MHFTNSIFGCVEGGVGYRPWNLGRHQQLCVLWKTHLIDLVSFYRMKKTRDN